MSQDKNTKPEKGTKKSISSYRFSSIQLPSSIEKINKDWVSWGGDNNFPNFIIELANKSSMNRRAILAKADAVSGKGFTTGNEATEYILNKANPKESWDEVLDKVALDYVMFGGYALNIIWSRDGKSVSEVYHIDFSKIRSGKLNDEDEVEEYYYCFDWKSTRKYTPIAYPAFSAERAVIASEENTNNLSQILYYKNYSPDQIFYPLPEYVGALNDIQLDISISTFHVSNLANGLTPSLWVHFPTGDPGPEGRFQLYEEISDAYSGAENGGRFFLTFSDGQDNKPEITPLSLSNDGYYLQLEERVSSRILSGHGISSPLLLGLRVGSSGLGSNSDEILTAWKHFQFTVIRPMQKTILKTFKNLMFYKGYPEINLSIKEENIF